MVQQWSRGQKEATPQRRPLEPTLRWQSFTQFHNCTSHGASFSTLWRPQRGSGHQHRSPEAWSQPIKRPGARSKSLCFRLLVSPVGHHGLLMVLTTDRGTQEPWHTVRPRKRQLSWATSPRSLSRTRKADPMTGPQDLSQGQSDNMSFLEENTPTPFQQAALRLS